MISMGSFYNMICFERTQKTRTVEINNKKLTNEFDFIEHIKLFFKINQIGLELHKFEQQSILHGTQA